MPQHDVTLSVAHPIGIGNVDVVFEVRRANQLLGRVKISKGGIDWVPAHKRQGIPVDWKEFSEWMES
jgi:hypothetical protein